MKARGIIFSIVVIILLSGCASSVKIQKTYNEGFPEKQKNYQIMMFYGEEKPLIEYVKIADIEVSWDLLLSWDSPWTALKKKARKLGGDAIINVKEESMVVSRYESAYANEVQDTPLSMVVSGTVISFSIPAATINYELSNSGFVQLEIYNIKDQIVITLVNKKMDSGKHSTVWNGLNNKGNKVVSGLYLYKLYVNSENVDAGKFLLK